jgi:hypothetical protein
MASSGDMGLQSGKDGYSNKWQLLTSEYGNVPYYPVIGNHDLDNSSGRTFISNTVLSSLGNIVRFGGGAASGSANYYMDHKNVRLIVLDQYTSFWGSDGWMDTVSNIIAAAANADHVFLSFHQPVFGRNRYARAEAPYCLRDGARQEFWDMLLSHNGKVKAIFTGHTHDYSRMRVLDPEGPCAASTDCFPDEEGGIYQIDCGAAGVGTVPEFVWIQVDGNNLTCVVKQKPQQDGPWNIVDLFEIEGTGTVNADAPGNAGIRSVTGLSVYPNPFCAGVDIKVLLQIENLKFQNYKFEISNIRGTKVFSKSILTNRPGVRWTPLDQPAGVYIVKVKAGSRALTKRIMLIK